MDDSTHHHGGFIRPLTGTLFLFLTIVPAAFAANVIIAGDVSPTPAVTPTWNVGGNLTVGDTGTGTLNVEAGGVVSNNSSGFLGYLAGSEGTATVTGAGSEWNNSSNLYVGNSGTGTLDVADGGAVSNISGYLGYLAGSEGTATVTGIGSKWNNSGELIVGRSGTGTLNVEDGGMVSNNAGFLGLRADSEGTATVTGAGSQWNNSGSLYVGFDGTGTLNVLAGGVVSNTSGLVGRSAGAEGTATVTGAGSKWNNAGSLSIGPIGTGTLNVADGGAVSNTSGYLGYNVGSEGTATVTGAGSQWNNAGILYVGRSGTGTLNVEDGGVVSNYSGYVGNIVGSEGTATVTGAGSKWNNASSLLVGRSGTGTLNVEDGGVVSNTFGSVGFYDGSEGTARVTGIGSQWNNSGDLSVGWDSTGTLNVEDGGGVSSDSGHVGRYADSEGTATVTGAGSQWNNSSNLYVGMSGTGTLNVEDDGVVSATSVLVGNSGTGTINIGTGTTTGVLNTASVNGGDGSSTLNFNHAEADYFFTNDGTTGGTAVLINGDMDVNHLGSGATTLVGANTYTGATGVDAGTLYVEGSLAETAVTVANSTTLGGSGSIAGSVTVQSGGTLAPGNSPGILTVGSLDLLSGSFTAMELKGLTPGTGHDQVVVNGTANLDGTLDLDFTGGTFANGDSFTLIDADAINNNFASINYLYGLEIVYETEITEDYVFRILGIETDFASLAGLDPELLQIALLLDDNFADAGLVPIINELNLLTDEDQPAAFEQINPQELIALAHFTFANARSNSQRLKNRQREIRRGATGFSTVGFKLYDETGQHIRQSLLADNSGSIPAGTKAQAYRAESKLSSYLSGSGTMRDFDGDSSGPGYEDDSFAVLLGADYRLADNLAVGAYLGYNHTNADLGGDGGNADLDSYRLGVTGTHWNPLSDGSNGIQRGYYTTAHAGLAIHDYATDRNAFGGDARGDTDAFEFDLGAAIGYEVDYTDFVLTTELSLDYVNLDTDGFTEKGSLAPLTIADDRSESLYSTLSVRMDFSYQIADIDVLPYVQIGWRHEFMDDSNSVAARFAASPGIGGFTVQGAQADRDSLIGSLGMTALLDDGLTASLGYFGEFSPDFQSHSLNGSINFAF